MRSLVLFCLALAACAASKAVKVDPVEDFRVIDVCVVNDTTAPVDHDVIRDAIALLSSDYSRRVGIDFAWLEVKAAFKPSGWPMDIAFFTRKVCPEDAEVRFVFTNRFVTPNQVSMTARGEGGQMAGDAHPYFGFVIAYSAEERWNVRNGSGERALVETLKHEVGHLFGLEHVKDRASFMYESSDGSLGRWTDDALKKIRVAKWKRWWPRA